MLSDATLVRAADLIAALKRAGLMLAAAESCTGGLVAGALTAIPGSSAAFERGFVTYSNQAKIELLGVEAGLIAGHGAVSEQVARAMAEGALSHSRADIAVSITGIAGPDGGSADKPVGLVHVAAARKDRTTLHEERRFGALGRGPIREASVRAALALAQQMIG